MRIVFIHRRGPGQFLHLAPHLASEGWEVTLVCETTDRALPGVRTVRHRAELAPHGRADATPHLATPEQHVRIGYRVADTLAALARVDGPPDLVFGHMGWGGLIFAKDVLPETPLIGYCEYYHCAEGGDAGFDPAEQVTLDDRQRLRLRNNAQLLTLDAMDGGISPTRWQKSRYPAAYQSRIAHCHDGIDARTFRPEPRARFRLPDGRVLAPGDPVVTYAARDLEPYRGFPQFMRAAARVARLHPDALFVVAGGDGISYGRPPAEGRNWREVMMAETGIDPARIVFLGSVPHAALLRLFQVSAAHVYLTYPFVLSWSVLEAMACGALVIGSATAPMEEVIQDGTNGLLTPFFDTDALTGRMLEALKGGPQLATLRAGARRTIVERYALDRCLARQQSLIGLLLGRRTASPAARAGAA
ncbi:glycosyltransferase family 4 protein [Azorhizobium doebereinerae]|uniref:glycosyltransferase family 4 protein n=1 Tax=Azorhizobium doebereinerae TaxID=281091 RepID=UPI00041B2FAE|nr:glycosyltransferase family 4 protein [Azorhizobium doebereinerae]